MHGDSYFILFCIELVLMYFYSFENYVFLFHRNENYRKTKITLDPIAGRAGLQGGSEGRRPLQ